MKKKETAHKTRKPGRFWMRLVIVLLTAVSIYRLCSVTAARWLEKEETQMALRYDRLYSSIVNAQFNTDNLTDTFNKWHLNRLAFLDHALITEGYDYSNFLTMGERYLQGVPLYVIDRTEGRMMVQSDAELNDDVISEILNRCADQTEGNERIEESLYYYRVLQDGRILIMRTDYQDYIAFLDNIYTPTEVIERNLEDENNFFFVVKDDVVMIHPDDSVRGEPVSEVMEGTAIPLPSQFGSSAFKLQVVNHQLILTVMQHIEESDMDLYYAIPAVKILKELVFVVLPVIVLIAFLLILYSLYLHYLRADNKYNRLEGDQKKSAIIYKSFTLIVLSVLITAGMAYYTKTLYGLSYFINNYKGAFEDLKYTVEDSELCIKDLTADFNDQAVRNAQMLGAYFSDFPERRTPEELKRMSELFEYDYIMLFDIDGNETVTDSDYIGYSISSDPDSPSSIFQPLRHGVPYIVGPIEEDELTRSRHQIIGAVTKNTEGHVDGFLQTVFYPERLVTALESSSFASALGNSVISNVFAVYIIDPETRTFVYDPIDEWIGSPAENYGFNKNNLNGNFSGYITISGVKCFAASTVIKDMYYYVTMGVELVFNGRAGFTLNAMLMVFIGLLIITLVESRMKIEKIPERPAEESEEQVSDLVYMVVKDDTTESASPFALNRNLKRKWPYMKAEEKLEVIISRVLLSIAVISTIILIFREEIFGRDSIITYIQSGNWPRGVNIFSVSAILFMAIMAIVAVTIIKGILNLLAKALTARAETICHLIRSCLEYTITIAVVYIAMGYLGVDIRALSATVGFLSLIIGFGAKSLITDIVAGLFIIFEGEFQVGDIVEIAGYRGMVKEIGLRTTKLISWDKNIKIINNHDIHNVINMTMRNSFASVSFTVPVTTSIEEVEQVFKEELPKLKQKYPQIIGDPYFAGILSFAGSKMKCRISAEVKELERGEMESQLHREVQEIMQRHNIPMK